MTLAEKFKSLTPKQQEKFIELKETAQLDGFLSETGMELKAEEKALVMEYVNSGKIPLSDEELENVAGGGCADQPSRPYPYPMKKRHPHS